MRVCPCRSGWRDWTGTWGARRGSGVVPPATYCLGGCLSVAATATAVFEMSGREVDVAGGGLSWKDLYYYRTVYPSGEVCLLVLEPCVVFPELVDYPVCMVCLYSGPGYHLGGPHGFHFSSHQVIQGLQLNGDEEFNSAVQ